jgi:ketosteroid isomerase-like protein
MSDPKIALVQKYLEAARQQDIPTMLASFTSDLVYRVPGSSPLAGETHGQSAALDYFGKMMKLTNGSYAITGIVDWLVSDDRVALIATETASRNGKTTDWTRVVLFKFNAGLISEVTIFDDKLAELDTLLNSQ